MNHQLSSRLLAHRVGPHLLPVPCPVEEVQLNLQRNVLNHVTSFTDSGRPSTSAGPVGGAVAGGDQQEIIVMADIHRENVDEAGMSMSLQVTQYNQM